MNKLIVNIIDSYWSYDDEELGIYELGKKKRYSNVFYTSLDIVSIEKQLKYEIMSDKNDGLELLIESIDSEHYIDVVLLLGNEDEKYNIDYIIDFLTSISEDKDNKAMELNSDTNNAFVYIMDADISSALKVFQENRVAIKLIAQTRSTYERGAGDYWIGYLLGIASSLSADVIKNIRSKLSKDTRSFDIANLNEEKLKSNLSVITGINIHNLRIVSFEEIEGEVQKYSVNLRTRYEKIKVICNKDGHIYNYSLDSTTQTRI